MFLCVFLSSFESSLEVEGVFQKKGIRKGIILEIPFIGINFLPRILIYWNGNM